MNFETRTPHVPVAMFQEEGTTYEIILPDADQDYIQRKLLKTRKPYELEMLQDMRQRVRQGDLILDVGANIGNHTFYLASVAKARVIAFEPNSHLCSAMRESNTRNNLESLVSVREIALGHSVSNAHFEKTIPENLGAQSLRLGAGDLAVTTLDSLEFDSVVRVIKIDVEGMELGVLRGGQELIEKDRPILYIECRDRTSFKAVSSWAQSRGYSYYATYNATPTHLFLPAEVLSEAERSDQKRVRILMREYRLIEQLRASSETEAEATAEISKLEEEARRLRDARIAAETERDRLQGELSAETATREHIEGALKRAATILDAERVSSRRAQVEYYAQLDGVVGEFRELHAFALELEQRYVAILNSNTWQVMEPVRKTLRLLRQRQRPRPFELRLSTNRTPPPTIQSAVRYLKAMRAASGGLPVDDLARKLWGGFSLHAFSDLRRAEKSTKTKPRDRVQAAWHLARWTAASGDWKACLSHLGTIAYIDKGFYRAKRTRILVIEANLRAGNPDKAIEYAEHGLNRGMDANYLCGTANALLRKERSHQVDTMRLATINRAYESEGLAKLAFINPAGRFVFGNLSTEVTQPAEMDGPKISILVPVYNAGQFLETAIGSLLTQTWRNIEIIAVDDGSTDDSWDKLQQLANDSRLRIFRNARNLGAYPTRNRALREATGELVTVHDSDDWSHPQMLEVQARELLSTDNLIATFSAMTRVLPSMEFTLRPERNVLEYVHRSYPSLMLRHSDLAKLGEWDGVAANADDELVQRIRMLWRKDSIKDVLPTVPLSFFLRHEMSLTEQKGTHLRSLSFGIRKEYADQAAFWRSSVKPEAAGLAIERKDIKTPFPIPSGLSPKNWNRDTRYDLVIISDLGLLGGTRRCNEGYLQAATTLGLRVGLFHWPRYDLQLSEVAPEYRKLSYQRNIDILVPEDEVQCDTILIHHPPILNYQIDAVPTIVAERVGILVNQLPMQLRSKRPHYYSPEQVEVLCQELFKRSPVWIPISPTTRRLLRESGSYRMSATDWFPPLDRSLPRARTPLIFHELEKNRPIVVGRHSRDHWTKWPETESELRAAYCADTEFVVRLMGGAARPKRILRQLPKNWEVCDFDTMPVDDFLGGIDFFLHFVHGDYIEEFGRNIMEAMARGIPTLLPHSFRETFGDAALYCAPEEVATTVRRLWSDPTAYRMLAERAYEYVLRTSDQRVVIDRLNEFVHRITPVKKETDSATAEADHG